MSSVGALLRLRSFRLLWAAHAAAGFADALASLALVLLAYRLAGSATAVAAAAIALALPQLLVGLPAGALVDRWDRRRAMVASDLARAVLVLGFLGVGGRLWLLYVLAFLQAAAGTVFSPARGALLADVLPEGQLLRANSLSETGRVVASVAGIAAAGAIAGAGGSVAPAFVLGSATFLLSATLAAAVRFRPAVRDGRPGGLWDELRSGLALVTGSRPLVGVLLAAGVVMLGLGATNVLLVPFLVDELAASETWFGPLRAAQVASLVLAGAALALAAGRLHPATLVTAGLAGIAGVVAGLSAAATPWHLLVLFFAAGWFVTPVQASVTTILQSQVPPAVRGRAQATFGAVAAGAGLLSMGLAGLAADAIGVRAVFLACGGVAAASAVVAAAVLHPTRKENQPCPATLRT